MLLLCHGCLIGVKWKKRTRDRRLQRQKEYCVQSNAFVAMDAIVGPTRGTPPDNAIYCQCGGCEKRSGRKNPTSTSGRYSWIFWLEAFNIRRYHHEDMSDNIAILDDCRRETGMLVTIILGIPENKCGARGKAFNPWRARTVSPKGGIDSVTKKQKNLCRPSSDGPAQRIHR